MARIMEISHLRPFEKHFLLHWLSVVMQSHSCSKSEKVFYLVFDMYFSWVYNSESIMFLSAFKIWFHLPNLLSS